MQIQLFDMLFVREEHDGVEEFLVDTFYEEG